MPDFSELLQRKSPVDNSNWLVLNGFWSENKKYLDGDSESPYLDGWFRINSILICKGDYDVLARDFKEKGLCFFGIDNIPSTQHEGFLGEYPWHTVYRHLSGWREPIENDYMDRIAVKHFIPYAKYEWEHNSNDYSLNKSLCFNIPAKELIQGMDLVRPSESGVDGSVKESLLFLIQVLKIMVLHMH